MGIEVSGLGLDSNLFYNEPGIVSITSEWLQHLTLKLVSNNDRSAVIYGLTSSLCNIFCFSLASNNVVQ